VGWPYDGDLPVSSRRAISRCRSVQEGRWAAADSRHRPRLATKPPTRATAPDSRPATDFATTPRNAGLPEAIQEVGAGARDAGAPAHASRYVKNGSADE
jgi:hypothetical protein